MPVTHLASLPTHTGKGLRPGGLAPLPDLGPCSSMGAYLRHRNRSEGGLQPPGETMGGFREESEPSPSGATVFLYSTPGVWMDSQCCMPMQLELAAPKWCERLN